MTFSGRICCWWKGNIKAWNVKERENSNEGSDNRKWKLNFSSLPDSIRRRNSKFIQRHFSTTSIKYSTRFIYLQTNFQFPLNLLPFHWKHFHQSGHLLKDFAVALVVLIDRLLGRSAIRLGRSAGKLNRSTGRNVKLPVNLMTDQKDFPTLNFLSFLQNLFEASFFADIEYKFPRNETFHLISVGRIKKWFINIPTLIPMIYHFAFDSTKLICVAVSRFGS